MGKKLINTRIHWINLHYKIPKSYRRKLLDLNSGRKSGGGRVHIPAEYQNR